MSHVDTDIDLALDDADSVYEANRWGRVVHGASTGLIVPAAAAVFAEFTDRPGLLGGAVVVFWLLFAVTVAALVMECREDQR